MCVNIVAERRSNTSDPMITASLQKHLFRECSIYLNSVVSAYAHGFLQTVLRCIVNNPCIVALLTIQKEKPGSSLKIFLFVTVLVLCRC